jgi:hypothetical protein
MSIIEKVVTYIALNIINRHPNNPRWDYDARALVPSILDHGLEQPLEVCDGPKETKRALRGNRRLEALGIVASEHPERFEELFVDGIPVIDHGKMTQLEELAYIVDHGNTKSLDNDWELYCAAKNLFRAKFSERKVFETLSSLLNQVRPLSKSAKAKLVEPKAKLEEAVKSGEREAIAAATKELDTKTFEARRGQMQMYSQMSRLPAIVEASFKYVHTGDSGAFDPEDLNKKLTQRNIGQLMSAFLEDAKNGGTKAKPGSKFTALWREFMDAAAETGSTTGNRTKALTSGEIKEPVENGQLASQSMIDLCKFHGGEKDVAPSIVSDIDEILAIVEYAKEKAADQWQALVDLYEEGTAAEAAALLKG